MLSLIRSLDSGSGPAESGTKSLLTMTENTGMLILFIFALLADVFVNGLGGDSNSRWLSFLDSLSHCSSWAVDDQTLDFQQRIMGTLLSKYGSGLIISLIFGITPSFLQTNTMLTFTLAMSLAQSNLRLAKLVRSRHGPWRLLFVLIGSLHKSRKLHFAIASCSNVAEAFAIGCLAIELTGWLVVASRAMFRREDILHALQTFIVASRMRFIFSVIAIFATYNDLGPSVPLLALIFHKAARFGEDSSLSFEVV